MPFNIHSCFAVVKAGTILRPPKSLKTVSAMNFYGYRLRILSGQFKHFYYFRQLLNQYWVDMCAKIETGHVSYIRNNQRKLIIENYVHLNDSVDYDANVQNLGQLVTLPLSFTGGPRYVQDVMTYVRKYERPDLFVTFTSNPKWSDITDYVNTGSRAT
jgi:hypothetical protein